MDTSWFADHQVHTHLPSTCFPGQGCSFIGHRTWAGVCGPSRISHWAPLSASKWVTEPHSSVDNFVFCFLFSFFSLLVLLIHVCALRSPWEHMIHCHACKAAEILIAPAGSRCQTVPASPTVVLRFPISLTEVLASRILHSSSSFGKPSLVLTLYCRCVRPVPDPSLAHRTVSECPMSASLPSLALFLV